MKIESVIISCVVGLAFEMTSFFSIIGFISNGFRFSQLILAILSLYIVFTYPCSFCLRRKTLPRKVSYPILHQRLDCCDCYNFNDNSHAYCLEAFHACAENCVEI